MRIKMAAWMLCCGVWCPRGCSAQPSAASQTDVEAVYLYNFARFVRWPAEAEHNTITICIAGPEAYLDTLRKVVAGERIGARPFAVRAVERAGQEVGCDILFFGSSSGERIDELLAASAGKPALTVSDLPGFLARGGMIQFVLAEDRVRFSVNLRPVARSGISLSSELLKVAAAVEGTPSDGGTP
jgi:hypothetical protein